MQQKFGVTDILPGMTVEHSLRGRGTVRENVKGNLESIAQNAAAQTKHMAHDVAEGTKCAADEIRHRASSAAHIFGHLGGSSDSLTWASDRPVGGPRLNAVGVWIVEEGPKCERRFGLGWKICSYSAEQQARLGVSWQGEPVTPHIQRLAALNSLAAEDKVQQLEMRRVRLRDLKELQAQATDTAEFDVLPSGVELLGDGLSPAQLEDLQVPVTLHEAKGRTANVLGSDQDESSQSLRDDKDVVAADSDAPEPALCECCGEKQTKDRLHC